MTDHQDNGEGAIGIDHRTAEQSGEGGVSGAEIAPLVTPMKNIQEYEEYHQKMIQMRWIMVGSYLIMVLILVAIPTLVDSDFFGEAEWVLSALIILNTLGLIAFIAIPFFSKMAPPGSPQHESLLSEVDRSNVDLSRPWIERVRMQKLFIGVGVVLVILAVTSVLTPPEETLATNIIVIAFVLVLMLIFSHLDVVCTPKQLAFHYGPVGKTFPLERIRSIRAISINPLKEYMGWGIRIGADGSIGYISAGKVGVRIELDKGNDYVVTVSDPQGLVDYVEAAKRQKREGEQGG